MSDYSKLKVTELKDLVKERGIPAAGLKLKQHYVDALTEYDEQGPATEEAAADGEPAAVDAPAEASTDAAGEVEKQPEEGASAEIQEEKEEYAQDGDSENRKRKRRSATPPVEAESTSKKLKAADEPAPDAEMNVNGGTEEAHDADASAQNGADVEMGDTAHQDGKLTPSVPQTEPQADLSTSAPADDASSARDRLETLRPSEPPADANASPAVPSKHPATRTLYIDGFVRPLQPRALEEHLASVASLPGAEVDQSIVEECYLDPKKTHAYVRLRSVEAATRARAALHQQTWPDEPQRKALWIDYLPDGRMQEFIATEQSNSNTPRWEVVYASDGDSVTVTLQDTQANARRPPNGPGQGVPGAPSGPRERSPPRAAPAAPSPRRPSPSPPPPAAEGTFMTLDERFSRTEAKPKIYFKPVTDDRFQVRWDALQHEKSRDWDAIQYKEEVYAGSNMRRYTFEDDRLVDSGVDFGSFGRPGGSRGGRGGPGGMGGGRGGYGRSGGRGGPRDRRGPRPGDFYSGGGYRR